MTQEADTVFPARHTIVFIATHKAFVGAVATHDFARIAATAMQTAAKRSEPASPAETDIPNMRTPQNL